MKPEETPRAFLFSPEVFMSYFYGFPIVAYVSLGLENDKSVLSSVQDYCRDTMVESEIFAEEVLPHEKERPLWQKVLDLIEREEISMLVVPDLTHIAGNDSKSLSAFLTFLKIKGVRLKSLAEGMDSQRNSRAEIISKLKNGGHKPNANLDLH